jgi:hypothetical protein
MKASGFKDPFWPKARIDIANVIINKSIDVILVKKRFIIRGGFIIRGWFAFIDGFPSDT